MNTNRTKVAIELDMDQLEWLKRNIRNSISHIEKHAPQLPIRKQRLESFRLLLKQAEEVK